MPGPDGQPFRKRGLCNAPEPIKWPPTKGFLIVRYQRRCLGRFRPPPDGLPRIRDRDRVDHGAQSACDGHDAAGAAEHRVRLPHHVRQPAADGAVDLSGRLRPRPVRDGPAVRPFRTAADPAWRHGGLLCRQPARDRGTLVRDTAAGAGAAGRQHLGDARDRHLDRARLLCRAAHGERDVAGDDDIHRRARRRAGVRPGRAAAGAVARHLHRADAVWRGDAGLERAAHAGDAGGGQPQIARRRRRCWMRSARP